MKRYIIATVTRTDDPDNYFRVDETTCQRVLRLSQAALDYYGEVQFEIMRVVGQDEALTLE